MPKLSYRKICIIAIFIFAVFLSGCNLLKKEQKEEIDPPKEVTMVKEEEESDEAAELDEADEDTEETDESKASDDKEGTEESVKTELYLFDKNGFVVPQTVSLPQTESVAKQALEYLVENGPVTEMLPNGFKAVLPADTKMTVNVEDNVATVDFSNEFKNYQAEDELKILQSVTWTLTQFDSIDKVKLQINGHPLKEMPVNGTPVADELSRKDGINLDVSNTGDITNTKPVTVYYIGGEKDNYYFVPVTKRVSNKIENTIEAAVQELVKGPNANMNLLNEFSPDAKLVAAPKVKDGHVMLNFNEAIYGSFEEKIVSDHVLQSLVLTLTEQQGIESVSLKVNGKAELVNEKGEKLTEPVMRPQHVNTGSF